MDIECSFGECVVLTPRNYSIVLRLGEVIKEHYAILGMASVSGGYPLYADAFNEKGLCIAGLNFPVDTVYTPIEKCDMKKRRIAPFELPLFLLSYCASADECITLLENIEIADIDFSEKIKSTPLHWHVADKNGSLVIECFESRLSVKRNIADVLANYPPLDVQIMNLASFQNLTPYRPQNCLSKFMDFSAYGKAFGSFGLPGDFSSSSRFVKSAYLAALASNLPEKEITLAHLFTLLYSVAVPKGAVVEGGSLHVSHHTLYTSCIDMQELSYNFRTYDSLSVKSVSMLECDIDGNKTFEIEI